MKLKRKNNDTIYFLRENFFTGVREKNHEI